MKHVVKIKSLRPLLLLLFSFVLQVFDFLLIGNVHRVELRSSVGYLAALRNSSTVITAARMSDRSVPLATSLWSGTESVALWLFLTRMIWLPRWRTTSQPKDSNTLTTLRPLSAGRVGITPPHPVGGSQWSMANPFPL